MRFPTVDYRNDLGHPKKRPRSEVGDWALNSFSSLPHRGKEFNSLTYRAWLWITSRQNRVAWSRNSFLVSFSSRWRLWRKHSRVRKLNLSPRRDSTRFVYSLRRIIDFLLPTSSSGNFPRQLNIYPGMSHARFTLKSRVKTD